MAAAAGNHGDIVKRLLEAGASVNLKNFKGTTALAAAVRRGHLDVVKILLEGGANIDITDKSGRPPLQIAKDNKHDDIVKYLKNSCPSNYPVCNENGYCYKRRSTERKALGPLTNCKRDYIIRGDTVDREPSRDLEASAPLLGATTRRHDGGGGSRKIKRRNNKKRKSKKKKSKKKKSKNKKTRRKR